MTATRHTNCTAFGAPVLYLALDLGDNTWKQGRPWNHARQVRSLIEAIHK
jgi:hypothetical protein